MKKYLPYLLFLSSCTLGPEHCVPEVCLPGEYEQLKEPLQEIDLTVWWNQFDDPMLAELIDEGLCCNYNFRIALRKIEELRGFYFIERSAIFPQLDANMTAIRLRGSQTLGTDVITDSGADVSLIDTAFGGGISQYFFQAGFDASWELDFFGKNRKRAEAGYHDFEASQESALDVRVTLTSDIAKTYIDIRTLQQQIKARQEQILRQKDLLYLAETRYRAGLVSKIDVVQARAQLDEEESELPKFEEFLQQTIHALANLLGRPPECFAEQFGEIGDIPNAMGRIPDDLPSELLRRRPDIRQVERELAASTARISVAKAQLFPSISLTGAFGVQSNKWKELFTWPSRFWTIGPTFAWNLFTGGRLIGQVKVANEQQKQAILIYEKTVVDALTEVENRLVAYFKEEKRLVNLDEKLDSNTLLRELTLDRYLSGLISFDQVLDAEKKLFITREQILETEGTLMTNLVGVYKSLGGGWDCCALQ